MYIKNDITSSFKNIVKWEQENFENHFKDFCKDDAPINKYGFSICPNTNYFFNSILYRGKYVDQIKQYCKFFGKENVYVTFLEYLCADPVQEMNKLFQFLEVQPI